MKRKSLAVLLAAASLSLSSGCATSGLSSAWSRTTSIFRPASDSAEGPETAVAGSKSRKHRKAATEDDLSPEFREAQKIFKNTEQTLLAWARYQEDVGEYAEARRKYRELLIAYPENTEASLGLARIELVTGRAQQAEEILTNLEQQHPDDIIVKLELGRMYSHQEMWPESLTKFEQACEIDPDDQTCRYELGVALARAHRFDSALSHLTFAVGVPAANYNIGYILHEEGNDADAVEWFRNAMQSHPDNQTAEKTKAMLAQLMPADARDQNSSVLARSRPQPGTSQGPVSYTNAGRQVAAQFTPAKFSNADAGQPLPVVGGSRYSDGKPLPPAVASTALPAATPGSFNPDGTPYRSVSYADPAPASGRAAYSDGRQPLQWSGPSSPPTAFAAPPNQAAQEPPLWRAHNN